MPPIPRKHYFSSRGAPWVVSERMTGLEVCLQAMIYLIQTVDTLGKEKRVNKGVRRMILDFLQAKQFVKAANARKARKTQMDEQHNQAVAEQAMDYHHYSGMSYANENYFRRESSMDRQWADERSRAQLQDLVAPFHEGDSSPNAQEARIQANLVHTGELSPRALARKQKLEKEAAEADGGFVTQSTYDEAPFGM